MTLNTKRCIQCFSDQCYLCDRFQSGLLIRMDFSRDQVAGELRALMRPIRASSVDSQAFLDFLESKWTAKKQ